MIDTQSRISGLHSLIDTKQFFVIHGARQCGKTTLLLDLTKELNQRGNYYAVYCSLEVLDGIQDYREGIPMIMQAVQASLEFHGYLPEKDIWSLFDQEKLGTGIKQALTRFAAKLDKPLIIFFDEADCLSGQTLITFLRQLRDGYVNRATIPFLHSCALVGMRNIRDYKTRMRNERETLGSSSPFNIVTESLRLRNFSIDEVKTLFGQHSLETGQTFPESVIEYLFEKTQGQPWLCNAIAREVIVTVHANDLTKTITMDNVRTAVDNIILRRDIHIDSLLERLKEERVRRVMEPIILGQERVLDNFSDDFEYVRDLGLIRNDRGPVEPANPIYAEVITRTLSYSTQEALRSDIYPYNLPRYIKDGGIDMGYLLNDFQDFWRENSAIWAERFQYKEAAPHLILQAFLQRIINGGGHILREMAAERKRLDLCVIYEDRKYPIELKIRYSDKVYQDGKIQLAKYLGSLGVSEGWLIVFDRRPEIPWDRKIFRKTEIVDSRTIHTLGC